MNRIRRVVYVWMVCYVISLIIPHTASAHVSKAAEFNINVRVQKPQDDELKQRLGNLQTSISIKYTPEVKTRILQYTVYHRQATEHLIGRAMLYFPLFDEEISKRNLPMDLKNVAVIESLLRPEATSKMGAAGLWQFIRSTGKMYDLQITDLVDERRDPKKSTMAALDYLESLYNSFGDWTLAIAAYNGGPGNVRKAIRKSGSKDFWTLRKYLPKETQAYVPRVIASMYLMNYYHIHNLRPRVPENLLQSTIELKPNKQLRISELSKELNVHIDVLTSLNPSYKKNIVPGDKTECSLIIPENRYFDYLKIHDKISFALLLENRRKAEEAELRSQRDSLLTIPRIASNYIARVSSINTQ